MKVESGTEGRCPKGQKSKMKAGMRALLRMAALSSFIFTLSTCDKEDDYRHPSVVTDYACLITDASGQAHQLRLDNGSAYPIVLTDEYREAHDRLPSYKADTTYRVISVYELDSDNTVHIYSLGSTLSSIPFPLPDGETLHRAPVYLQSTWLSGDYLNMVIEVKALNGQHSIGFVDTTPEGMHGKEFTFYHRVIKDVESYRQRLYGSIPLVPFSDSLQQGDTLRFVINTYDEGLKAVEYAMQSNQAQIARRSNNYIQE